MALALTLCDQLERDPRTGKFNLTGIFFQFTARHFPMVRPIGMYACLTDGRGRTQVQIRLIDVNEARPPVFEYVVEVDFEEPGFVIELGAEATEAAFPAPGKYTLQLIAADATIVERSIYANVLLSEQEN